MKKHLKISIAIYIIVCLCNAFVVFSQPNHIESNTHEVIGKRETVDKWGDTHFKIYSNNSKTFHVSYETYNNHNVGQSVVIEEQIGMQLKFKILMYLSMMLLYTVLHFIIYFLSVYSCS